MYTVYLQGNILNILSLLAHCSKGLYSRFECPSCDAEQDVITFPVKEGFLVRRMSVLFTQLCTPLARAQFFIFI